MPAVPGLPGSCRHHEHQPRGDRQGKALGKPGWSWAGLGRARGAGCDPEGLGNRRGRRSRALSQCQHHAIGRDVQDRVRSAAQPAGTGPSLDLGLFAPSSRFVP